MEFSHQEAIALAKALVECSDCGALIDEDDGSIVHNLPDCKVAAVEARLDVLGVAYTRPKDMVALFERSGWAKSPISPRL